MSASSKPVAPREAISIPYSAWDQIVNQLDQEGKRQHGSTGNASPQREARTRHTKVISCVLRIKQEGCPAAVFKVKTRNFSGGGLGFFFNQYLHGDTVCHFAVVNRHGVPSILEGEVRWCRHVSNNLHECGVQFSNPVDPNDFVDIADTPSDAA